MGSKVIVAKDLKISYGNETIIENSSFSISSGEMVFLTGASGSGKTTILKHLYGELKPTSGFLNVGGFDMKKATNRKLLNLRKYIGVVFQDYKLISDWNIEKNVMLPLLIAGIDKKLAMKKVHQFLAEVKLSHRADKYPTQLSGGEQQRAGVARAIINEPVLILADEPTGNLDGFSADSVMKLFKKANELGITLLIATHHLPEDFEVPYRQLHIEDRKIYEVS
jgi:cell division transport system ATP-binding protein